MIDIQRDGKIYVAKALVPGTAGVTLFKACFYESAVAQSFVRDGDVVCDGQRLERARKVRKDRWGNER